MEALSWNLPTHGIRMKTNSYWNKLEYNLSLTWIWPLTNFHSRTRHDRWMWKIYCASACTWNTWVISFISPQEQILQHWFILFFIFNFDSLFLIILQTLAYTQIRWVKIEVQFKCSMHVATSFFLYFAKSANIKVWY